MVNRVYVVVKGKTKVILYENEEFVSLKRGKYLKARNQETIYKGHIRDNIKEWLDL